MSNTRPTRATSDRPSGVSINLDTLSREVTFEPFVAVVEGKRFEMDDPNEMDWKELAYALEDPRLILQLALTEDDYRTFMSMRVPTWKMRTLAETYMRHYGIEPETLQGNRPASLR